MLVRRLLQILATVCALEMLLLLFPLVLGSAEDFPTEEKQEKVRIAAGFLILLLAAAGGMSFMALKRMKP